MIAGAYNSTQKERILAIDSSKRSGKRNGDSKGQGKSNLQDALVSQWVGTDVSKEGFRPTKMAVEFR